MARYTFKLGGPGSRTVEASDLADALKLAGIGSDEPYEVTEEDDPYRTFLLAAIMDETFDS